jgi:hypothetical protein
MPSEVGSRGVSNLSRLPRGSARNARYPLLSDRGLFIDAPRTRQFWSDRVPRVRILSLRQHVLRGPSLCPRAVPKSPGIRPFFADGCAPHPVDAEPETVSFGRVSPRLFTWPIRYPLEFFVTGQGVSVSALKAWFAGTFGYPRLEVETLDQARRMLLHHKPMHHRSFRDQLAFSISFAVEGGFGIARPLMGACFRWWRLILVVFSRRASDTSRPP